MYSCLLIARHKTATILANPVLFTWFSRLNAQTKWFTVGTSVIFLTALVSFHTLDLPLATTLHSHLAGSTTHTLLKWFTWFGEGQWVLVPAAVVYWVNRKKNSTLSAQALYVFVTNAMSGIAVNIIKVFLPRYRPLMFFSEGASGFTHDWVQFEPSHLSFPSGHTVTVFSLAIAVGFLRPKYRWHFVIFASMIATSRVLVTAHYLSDVLIGAWFGVALTLILTRRYFSRTVAC